MHFVFSGHPFGASCLHAMRGENSRKPPSQMPTKNILTYHITGYTPLGVTPENTVGVDYYTTNLLCVLRSPLMGHPVYMTSHFQVFEILLRRSGGVRYFHFLLIKLWIEIFSNFLSKVKFRFFLVWTRNCWESQSISYQLRKICIYIYQMSHQIVTHRLHPCRKMQLLLSLSIAVWVGLWELNVNMLRASLTRDP